MLTELHVTILIGLAGWCCGVLEKELLGLVHLICGEAVSFLDVEVLVGHIGDQNVHFAILHLETSLVWSENAISS